MNIPNNNFFRQQGNYTGQPQGQKRPPVNTKGFKWGVCIVAGVLVVGLLASQSFYQIQEQEQAVLVTLGKPKAVTETGLHFKIPFLQQVKKVNTTIQGFPIGYASEDESVVDSEGVMITNDYNFIDVDFFVEYRITEPVQYLFASRQPEDILKSISQGSIRTVIGSYKVDDVLTTGKGEIQSKIKDTILKKMEVQDIGIQLVNITIQDSEPPTAEVMQAFKAVETAKQGKETALNNANKYRNEKLPEAEANADQIIKDAEATKQTRINEAEGQASRFNALYTEYEKNPAITKQRMYYETMEEVLPGMKIVIDNGSGIQKMLPLEPFAASENTSTDDTTKESTKETTKETEKAPAETQESNQTESK